MKLGEINRQVCRVGREHYRRSFAEFAKFGITQGQPRILGYLITHDGCIQRELCENCHLEPATVTNIMANMEKAGLIERRSVPEDRRILCVYLTQKGREAQKHVEQVHIALENECFEGFTNEEKELAAGFLRRMADNLTKAEGISKL